MRYIKLYFLTAITALMLFSHHCNAQDISAIASINKDSIYAGQPIEYYLNINIPKDYIIEWNNFNDTLSHNIEILDVSEATEMLTNNGKDLTISKTLKLTTFDTGYVEIPRLNIKYHKTIDDTSTYEFKTNILDLYVKGVSIDTTNAYRDIKAPIKQNFTFEESVPYIGGVIILAGLVLLIIFLVRYFRKKRSVGEIEEVKPKIPAIVTAREKMLKLKDANLWQSGKLKEYYTDLTDIVREYLEGQFCIEAIEMTSDEIVEEVKKLGLDISTQNKLQETLLTADLVKFAKANTTSAQNDDAFSNINSFIEDSYTFQEEMERKKMEEERSKKYDFDDTLTEQRETEDTK